MISTRYFDKWTRRDASPSPRALSSCIALAMLVSSLAVLTPASAGPQKASRERRPPRPNVLIFVTDDQRFDTLKHMPATRRLIARKGVTFRNAFATTPLCCPARASIMTGQYAHTHNVRRNSVGRRFDLSTTLQRNLGKAGYLTAIVGKFLNGWSPTTVPPDFDTSAVLATSRRILSSADGYTDSLFNVNGRMKRVHRYATDFMRARANRNLRRFNRDDRRPWMMYVNSFAPHHPAIPAPRHSGTRVSVPENNPATRNDNQRDKAPVVRKFSPPPGLRHFAERQVRTLFAVDEMVASVFRTMKRLNEVRRTLVVFLSDNGMMWGEHGLASKRWPYTHSAKIPLLLSWPDHVRRGIRTKRIVANIDVAPTIYAATRIRPDHVMDGKPLLSSAPRRSLLLENWDGIRWKSIRTRNHQYIEYDGGNGPRRRFRELYRLTNDPWQVRNLLHENPRRHREVAARLHRLLVRKADCKGARCL